MNIKRPPSRQPMPDHAKLVFKGVMFDVYQWEQEGYDGTVKIFEKIKRADTSMVVAVTENGEIMLAKQEQPGKAPFIDLLGGRVDEGEDPLDAAKRELLEESGCEANEWALFDAIQPVSKIEWAAYYFIARGCKKVSEQNLDGAEKIELMYLNFDEFVDFVISPDFGDCEFKSKFYEAKLNPAKMQELRKLILGE